MIARRTFISAGIAGGVLIAWAPVAPAKSDVLTEAYGAREFIDARVSLKLPSLAENGNSVALTVNVESPMTRTDYCREVRIFAHANPVPNVGAFRFSPASGRARVATRIRLSDTQTVTAVAEMSDGTLYAGAAETIVTLAACIEPLI